MDEVPDAKKEKKIPSKFRQALSGFNKKYIDEAVDFWLNRNVDPMLISGIFGNISAESDWNPLSNANANNLGDFYGLVQMSKDMRKEVKRVYGKVDSKSTHQFIYDAMTGNKKISQPWRNYMKDYGGYWNNTYNDPEAAAMAFGTVFERPSEKYANWNERMSSAKDAYDYITSIINARDEAKNRSFANPIKTTVTGDGRKVMTVNPDYWKQQQTLKQNEYLADQVPQNVQQDDTVDVPFTPYKPRDYQDAIRNIQVRGKRKVGLPNPEKILSDNMQDYIKNILNLPKPEDATPTFARFMIPNPFYS